MIIKGEEMLELVLQKIDALKSRLDALRPFDQQALINIKNSYILDQTYHSNAIEGSTLTFSETKLILNEGITIGGKTVNEHLEVINHKDALFFLEELVTQKSTVSAQDVKQLHYLVLKGIDTQAAGTYREKNVGVRKSDGSVYKFVEPIKINDAMHDFIDNLNETTIDHPVIQAAKIHYQFVTIHPFVDGNGRTARLLMNLILMQSGYIPALINIADRAGYIQGLEIAQQDNDLSGFYLAIANAELDSLKQYIMLLENDIELI